MRSHAVNGFQMFRVHQKSREFIAVLVEPEEHADSHIVDAALHRAVHGLGVVAIVVLRAGRVQRLIALLVVGLLE